MATSNTKQTVIQHIIHKFQKFTQTGVGSPPLVISNIPGLELELTITCRGATEYVLQYTNQWMEVQYSFRDTNNLANYLERALSS